MKRCPQCNRTYNDETFTFCLADGMLLSPSSPLITDVLPNQNNASSETLALPEDKKNEANLFPLYGVVLGETSVAQFAQLGQGAASINFKHNDKGVINKVFLMADDPFPEQWKKLGFDAKNSYLRWLNLLPRLGWQIVKANYEHDGNEFNALILAKQRTHNFKLIWLDIAFVGVDGQTIESEGTLFALEIGNEQNKSQR